jgi:MYXO-CTERM domain-containing protein
MRFLAAFALFVGIVISTPSLALADCTSANVNVSKATRSKASYSVAAYAFFISQQDCNDGDVFTFPYVLSNIGTSSFEVWVAPNSSTDCSDKTARDNSTGTTKCTQVYVDGAPAAKGEVKLKASVIAAAIDGVSGCTFTGSNTAPIPTNIFFMLVPGANTTVDASSVCKWADTSVDLTGPLPPTDVQAGIGDTIATLSYTIGSNQQDTLGYKFFCDPPPGAASSTGGAGGTGGTGGTGSTTNATTAATTGAGGAGGTGGSGGGTTSTTAGSGGASSGTNGGASGCPSSVLVAGQVPDLKYECGKTNGASGNATGLTNGVTYAIGVAGYDNLGNVGKLSTMVCVTPGPVDDFWSVYKQSGGKAGGCTVVPSAPRARVERPEEHTEGAGLAVGVGLLGLAALRRRRARTERT